MTFDKKKKKKKAAKNLTDGQKSSFDPSGSYTGVSEDGQMPVQDADDL
jgi:hypothetical protein